MNNRSSFKSFLVIAGLLVLVAVIILGGAAAWGWNSGVVERQSLRATRAAEHFQKGLDAEANGQPEMARSEFDLVLRLDPSFKGVREHLQTATPPTSTAPALAVVGTPQAPAPALPSITPRPTLPVDQPAGPGLLKEAQALLDAGQVEQAVMRLEQIRSLEPNYQPQQVTALLFTSYIANGDLLANQGRSQEALRAYDAALTLQPGDVDVLAKRELASMYGVAMASWGVDWDAVIRHLETLYARNPNFADVSARLAMAYSAQGNAALRADNPCAAVDLFTHSLSYVAAPDVADLRDQATSHCQLATSTPAPSATWTLPAASAASATPSATLRAVAPTAAALSGSGTIAFSVAENGRGRVYLISLDGKILSVIENAAQPAFGTDGSRLAVHSLRAEAGGIGVVNRDGSNWLRISTFAEDSQPSVSADGGRVAFASNREGDRRWRLYVTPANLLSPAQELGLGQWPTWSPDGKSIAYQGCDPQSNHCGIWIKGADGSNPHILTEGAGDHAPVWSPDGTRVAFASSGRAGNWGVYIVTVATGEINPVAPHPIDSGQPAWSPDGRSLAFLSRRDGNWAIYVVALPGGEPRKVIDVPGKSSDWFNEKLSWAR